MSSRSLVTLAVVCALGAFIGVSQAKAAWPGQNGRVIFNTFNGTADRIWTANADGTGLREILESASGYARIEDVSPDGSTILYFDLTYGQIDSISVDPPSLLAGGTLLATVPQRTAASSVFSPDGTRIAYLAHTDANRPGLGGVWVMSRTGANKRQLVVRNANDTITEVRWSPDGSSVGYLDNGTWFQLPADGSGSPTPQATPYPESPGLSPISPDGKKKVFVACCDPDTGSNPQVYVSNADGSGRVRLTASTEPGWSPTRLRWQTVVDSAAPSAPTHLVAAPGTGKVALSWHAASDNVGVALYNVHRGSNPTFQPTAANRIGQPTAASFTDTGLAPGVYYYKVTAQDAAGNVGPAAVVRAVVAANGGAGLVAAYGFEEGSGPAVADASGSGNNGTVSGAAWAAGKHGKALSFDGVNDLVTVPDSSSLDLTSGMTLEAWVQPTALGSSWRTVVFKEQPGNMVYDLYAGNGSVPNAGVWVAGGERSADGVAALPLNVWTHLAATYDGSALRLFVNGVLVRSASYSGPIATSSGALRIGGNSIWSEWFKGLIDDVRVYDRPLGATEIQTDMTRGV